MGNTNKLSRRKFLRNTSIGIGGAIIAPSIIPSCVNGANDKVMVGHIGVGSMGGGVLKSWMMPVNQALNVATCDPFLSRRDSAAQYINNTYQEQGVSAP